MGLPTGAASILLLPSYPRSCLGLQRILLPPSHCHVVQSPVVHAHVVPISLVSTPPLSDDNQHPTIPHPAFSLICMASAASAGAADINIAAMKELYMTFGQSNYIGEAISGLEHGTQAAACATAAGYGEEVVIAALLHDIGHLIGLAKEANGLATDADRMGEFGVQHHERIGAELCAGYGLPETTCQLIEQHVNAKRYLCWKNPAYHGKLSDASKATLTYQGGPMEEAEALAFEANPLKDTILRMRTWDEAAKVVGWVVPTFDAYEPVLRRLMLEGSGAAPC